MADYNLEAKITADASGYEAGVKKAEKASKKLSTTISGVIKGLGKNGLVGALGAVGLASQGLTSTLGAVVKIARKVSETMNECTNAYKAQLIAERSLDTAIQNNPFVTGASADALKEFASEMQKVSNYGDEELIPMMANLVSLGRTESETMQIMSVAMDMSAGMGISLDTAITQLNATLNGSIGRLGQQNAELKDLTEEELKQGKAIEILGEKFKGLSSATADTSKQLQNIKGDFKEALGQFTLPSSDLWNKFWAGFYERGIEVINKINSYLDAQTIGKKLAGAITDQLKAFGTGDVGGRIDYIRNALKVVTDEELLFLQNYLEGLAYISSDQEQILRRIKAETDARKQSLIDQKAQAEASAKQKREEEEKLAKQKELEEQEKKNAEERAKALKLQSEWADKLFAIRLENLEKTREKELENEELTQEQKEAINKFYGDQVLTMKIKQIEKERDEVLAQENLTEEAKRSINLYYENKITQANAEENDKRLKLKKKINEEEKKDEKSKFTKMLEMVKQYAENVKKVFSKIASTIKNVFSAIGNIFNKALDIFNFNPDDALTNLLKVEDAILTFFVETLPKLPSFFASAIQSIMVLLNNLVSILDWEGIQKMLDTMIDAFIQNAPTLVDNILDIVINIVQTVLNALIHFVEAGGWKMILDILLTIQKRIEGFVVDNIDEIVNTITDMIPDLVETLKESIVSASKTLGKIAPKILPMIADLINGIVDVITSDEVIDSANEAVEGIVEGLVEAIIKLLPNAIMKILNMAIKLANPQRVSKLAIAIVKGLVKAFQNINWLDVVVQCFMGFIDGFKELFGIHSPSTLFESFGQYMIEGLILGIQGMADALNSVLQPIYNLVVNIFGQIGNIITSSISVSFSGLTSLLGGINSGIAQITNSVANLINSLANLISTANQAVSALNPFSGGSSGGSSGGGSSTAVRVATAIATGGLSELPRLFGFANGSQNVPKGLSIVGEAGPELVKFRGGEQVLNNRNTNKALENMGGKTNNFNVTFNNLQDTTAFNMMQQLKAYNRQMAINGVI